MTAQVVGGRAGWLAAQLPPAMARDRVIAAFVRSFEEIADTVREQVSDIEYELDVNLASPEMLSYLASWLGVEIGTDLDAGAATSDDQRRLIRAVGQALVWRGTRRGIETLLEALTGSRVHVTDSGGVFGPTDRVPPADEVVIVELDHTGPLTREQLEAFLSEELPIGTQVRLQIRSGGRS